MSNFIHPIDHPIENSEFIEERYEETVGYELNDQTNTLVDLGIISADDLAILEHEFPVDQFEQEELWDEITEDIEGEEQIKVEKVRSALVEYASETGKQNFALFAETASKEDLTEVFWVFSHLNEDYKSMLKGE